MRWYAGLLILGLLLTGSVRGSSAQTIALGAQFGAPTGVALNIETSRGIYDALAAWDLGSFLFIQGHQWVLYGPLYPEQPRDISYFTGPGAVLGIRVHERSSDVVVGLSGNFGLRYKLQRVAFFFQLTPRLELLPATRADIGGGIGFLYDIQ